jgi:uncharacterized protein YjbJ (UPF0337 family)
MNWDQIAGKWLQLRGGVRQRWGKLTGNDLQVIAGGKDKFIGRVQVRYGITKEETERQIELIKMSLPADPRSRRKIG